MKSKRTMTSIILLAGAVLVLSGCSGGSGYSSVGVSYGNYWGPYGSYRPGYDYNYRYSTGYRSYDRHRSKIGRPDHRITNAQHRPRPERRSGGGRPARRR